MTKKIISFMLALILAFSAMLSANAADLKETKTSKFIEKAREEKAITVNFGNFRSGEVEFKDLSFYARFKNVEAVTALVNKVFDIYMEIESADIDQEEKKRLYNEKEQEIVYDFLEVLLNNIEIKASTKVKYSIFSANLYFDGKELTAYLGGFIKINLSKVGDINIFDVFDMFYEYIVPALIMDYIIQYFSECSLADAIIIENTDSSMEKFSFSTTRLLAAMSAKSEQEIQQALISAGYDITGKTEKEIKEIVFSKEYELLKDLEKQGVKFQGLNPNIPVFVMLITESLMEERIPEELDLDINLKDLNTLLFNCYFSLFSYEFVYSGDSIIDIGIKLNLGDESMAKSLQSSIGISGIDYDDFSFVTLTAGKGKVKNPPFFSFDLTNLLGRFIGDLM